MKYRKSIQSLICGLGAAVLLLACLPTAALAATKQPTFSAMFPDCVQEAKDPKAVEAVLAGMGTAIGQSQTVKGVTLTLNGALWSENRMLLSFSLDGAEIPADIPSGTYLNRQTLQVTLAERQREAYVRREKEEREKIMSEIDPLYKPSSKEEMDADVQAQVKRGEPQLFHNVRLIRSGGKDYIQVSVTIPPYVEKPELTVHLDSLAVFKNAESRYRGSLFDGYEPITLAPGPYDFTFTAENHRKPMVYTGAVDVTAAGNPIRVQRVTVTPFHAEVEYETIQKADMESEKDSLELIQKLEQIKLSGVWTKDGQPLSNTDGSAARSFSPDQARGTVLVTTDNTYPCAVDPATVAAVDIGGVRVDLSRLTLQENLPLQDIKVVRTAPAAEPEQKAESAQPAGDFEKKLEEAKKIAYQDLEKASPEMQAKILEARKIIINSTSWVADGYNGSMGDGKGGWVPLPHFSDLFPGWEMPKA